MQPKISKTLEGIIARSAFNTTKAGMTHSLKDFLTLELLREEGRSPTSFYPPGSRTGSFIRCACASNAR